jgi:hypothetical protein
MKNKKIGREGERKGHKSGEIAVKLRNQSISPTREFKQGLQDINTLSSSLHLSEWILRDLRERKISWAVILMIILSDKWVSYSIDRDKGKYPNLKEKCPR